jgi:hypothetical protein
MWWDELNDPDFQEPKFFPSTTKIINAVTGKDTGFKTGSKDESRFYVVEEKERFFFESPQQYEAITGKKVSKEEKQKFKREAYVHA